MKVPEFPQFVPLSLCMRDELYPSLNLIPDGVSEFTFSGLYLFRQVYNYKISRFGDDNFLVSGNKGHENFFFSPCCIPDEAVLKELFKTHSYMKNMTDRQCEKHRVRLECQGYSIIEDRDNFDYLYNREDLATLSGKKYHKKRNQVNAFINSYSYEQKPLDESTMTDAVNILDAWHEGKGEEGDYHAAREALELYTVLGMRGAVYYVDGRPAGYALGEPLAKGRMFAVHFEKAIGEYKGIYQFINQAFAQALPRHIKIINREQDLGDEGLRQAKMTYRPTGFVNKYRVYPSDAIHEKL